MAIDLLIAVLLIVAEPGDSGSRKQSATRRKDHRALNDYRRLLDGHVSRCSGTRDVALRGQHAWRASGNPRDQADLP